MGSREEEYLRRMRALGYQDSLAGMGDDDIEWELSKMEEAERRRETPPQPLRTVYRPVDPGLKARILRQFGQPYDESAIPKGQEFYLNGWDNGEEEEKPLPLKPAPSLFSPSRDETRRPVEPTNYWDAVLKRSREGDTGNWINAMNGSSGKDSGTNWWVDPMGMFPEYGGDTSGSEARIRYRDNEVVKAQNSGGYMDAGASRDNEARSGTADEFTFTSDPLESMRVRRDRESNAFGMVRVNNDGTPRPHQGVDIYAEPGTPVRSVENGKVVEKDYHEDGYGNWVKVEFEKNGKKYYAFYAHLSDPAEVNVGDSVMAGQVIGRAGNSGNATGMTGEDAHLHFEVHTQPGFGEKLKGRRDPMPHFQTKMKVNKGE